MCFYTMFCFKNNSRFSNMTYQNAKVFIPPITECIVLKVYDGDTITIGTQLYNDKENYKFQVRLRGIDCPEIKTKNNIEHQMAEKAREFVRNKTDHKIINLKNINYDKYGRLLANVIVDNVDLSDELIKERLAVAYDGGTKIVPKNWEEYNKNGKMD